MSKEVAFLVQNPELYCSQNVAASSIVSHLPRKGRQYRPYPDI